MSDKELEARGLKIRYRANEIALDAEHAKTDPVVLFHGKSFSLDNWYDIGTVDALSERGFPVYAIDLPSGRASKSGKVSYENVSEYVPILDSIFTKLKIGISKPMIIVGPSMGGGFALAYSLARPQAVKALVLIGPALHTLDVSSFKEIKVPVLLVWGERDEVFPLERFGNLLKEKLVNCKLVILKNAGHPAYLDKPKEFNEILLGFLEEITRNA